MSKLEEQKALPRRKLFKPEPKLYFIDIEVPKPKRKAKKAKAKR